MVQLSDGMSTSFRHSHLTGEFSFTDIDVSGYRAINSDKETVAITIRSTLYKLIRG
jgi:hypothetical protein